ncbi:histidine kinase [Streptomyces sp. SPB162]|uniref:sensor histidine kinase n=1 Tax=Streptomyces sp. SPB162 TaxID=2940560 RepID=UPI0024062F42|nr:histidine kinase [Streptomyces sp. SPB162]MDF9816533.1 signal transduction histidine kinase [Streptomyces sp. SPB162]
MADRTQGPAAGAADRPARDALYGSGAALFGRPARLRWVHLILGGALLMPFYLLMNTTLNVAAHADEGSGVWVAQQFGAFVLALPIAAAAAAAFPLVRDLEGAAARALGAGPAGGPLPSTDRTWAARARTSCWFVLHVGLGGIVSGMTLAVPPAAVVLVALPFSARLRATELPWVRPLTLGHDGLAPLAAALLLALLALTAKGAAALLARCSTELLGPTPIDRLAAAEQRTVRLALRNRLARELHDSVGHALSAVTLQAGAARRVLDRDPEFARQALAAIEETTRRAVAELDDVLGLLREDGDGSTAPLGPALDGLDALLDRTRAAGVPLDASVAGDLGEVPPMVSREAYRIVQEGLSNALRHAGQAPVLLRIDVMADELEIEMVNPVVAAPARRTGGGRGLIGVEERTTALRGRFEAGTDGSRWRLHVALPLGSGNR